MEPLTAQSRGLHHAQWFGPEITYYAVTGVNYLATLGLNLINCPRNGYTPRGRHLGVIAYMCEYKGSVHNTLKSKFAAVQFLSAFRTHSSTFP